MTTVSGAVRTEILRTIDSNLATFINYTACIFGKSSWQGCQTTIHCVMTDENVSGKYYADCKPATLTAASQLGNVYIEKKIFEETKKILKL